MRRQSLAIALVSAITLMLELALTRVFDVTLGPNLAYMVITCALFGFGLAGIYAALRPPTADHRVVLAAVSVLFGLSVVALRPVMNLLPFDPDLLTESPVRQTLGFAALYLALVVPFFLSGLLFVVLFSQYAAKIQTLYLWDLAGAAVGCVILIPFIPVIGPGGLMLCAGGVALFAAALFSPSGRWAKALPAAGVALIALPFLHAPRYYDFTQRRDERGLQEAREQRTIEVTRWDPISKIEVLAQHVADEDPSHGRKAVDRKLIVYDGGNQISYFIPFDGNFERLRDAIARGAETGAVLRYFPRQRALLASHYLKRDSRQKVLVIGSAGGQEIAAALAYGAERVDGIDLVRAVIDLGRTRYGGYIGNLFTHPRVRVRVGEGRSFLRSSAERYDIIQIFSNHTSSSIAAGTGAMDPTYLQTAEAYEEYFRHLTPNGVLHVNHYAYPRMITTAALAWKRMGRSSFQRHVAVFERPGTLDNTPTLLVKMSPWTGAELRDLNDFFAQAGPDEHVVHLVENPLAPAASFLSAAFYAGDFPPELARQVPYRVTPATDDKPYFRLLRKRVAVLEPDAPGFVNVSMALLLNSQLKVRVLPRDLIHLIVVAVVSLVFVVLFVAVPLKWAEAGTHRWPGKYFALTYFACLGAGFIVIELVLIQIFMKLVGFPLYTYSTVLFTMLLAAGIGSGCSEALGVSLRRRWALPFAGVLVAGVLLLLVYPQVFGAFLAAPLPVRVLVSAALIFPLAFFLGMPFPLGIKSVESQPRGTVAWAWGLNGAFTVAGGLASVVASILLGFNLTLIAALCVYALAFAMLYGMRRAAA